MNWGTKLVIGMLTFMTFIVVLGVLMIRSKNDALVDNDYYEKGIRYNEDYDKKERVKKDQAEPLIQFRENTLLLGFKAPAQGTLKLIRSADKKLDRTLPIETREGNHFEVPLDHLARGLWKIQLEWKSAEKSYLYEKELVLR